MKPYVSSKFVYVLNRMPTLFYMNKDQTHHIIIPLCLFLYRPLTFSINKRRICNYKDHGESKWGINYWESPIRGHATSRHINIDSVHVNPRLGIHKILIGQWLSQSQCYGWDYKLLFKPPTFSSHHINSTWKPGGSGKYGAYMENREKRLKISLPAAIKG